MERPVLATPFLHRLSSNTPAFLVVPAEDEVRILTAIMELV